jgi:hypothetical protein
MTLEELAAKLEKMTSDITAIKTTTAEKDAEIERLRRHNAKVLDEKKKLKARARDADDDDDADDDEDDAPTRAPRRSDDRRDADLGRIQAEHKAQLDALKKELDDERAARNKAAIDAALVEAMDTAGIAPQYRPAVRALLTSAKKFEVVDGAVRIDGVSAVDSVKSWAQSDEGKTFVAAPASGGSATPQSAPRGRTPQNTQSAAKPRSQMSHAERGAYIREHGAEAYQQLPK